MTTTLHRPAVAPGRDGFGALLHAEWTKFRTVRGWVIGLFVAAAVTVLVGLLGVFGTNIGCQGANGGKCDLTPPLTADGLAVHDGFTFVHRPLAGDGTLTVRVSGLTGVHPGLTRPGQTVGALPWAKAGIMVKAGTAQGSPYALVALTGAHGVRMQYGFTEDRAGMAGLGTRWLRITRSGGTITGYDSADGTTWHLIGTATVKGLPATAEAGIFTTSPAFEVTTHSLTGAGGLGAPGSATATFDGIAATGSWQGSWQSTVLGGGGGPELGTGTRQDAGGYTLTGFGDIGPITAGQGEVSKTPESALSGAFTGLIAVVVVAALFVTVEYRRGLIRTTFIASPRRVRVLMAKAVVVAGAAFATGAAAAAVAVPVVAAIEHSKGIFVFRTSALTGTRIVLGAGLITAAAAVLALAIGALLRRSAGAVTAVIVVMVLPYILAVASVLPDGPSEWLARLTPAAGFSLLQSMPVYPQVPAAYSPADGYFPLPPWGGYAVLCGWAAVLLALAAVRLNRSDV